MFITLPYQFWIWFIFIPSIYLNIEEFRTNGMHQAIFIKTESHVV